MWIDIESTYYHIYNVHQLVIVRDFEIFIRGYQETLISVFKLIKNKRKKLYFLQLWHGNECR